MLTDSSLEQILERLPGMTIGVVGDLFLDRYLDIDSALTEPSVETGLDAYQVVGVRSQPGAAGTVINNLIALDVGSVVAMSVIGDDGEGYELRQALETLQRVDLASVWTDPSRRTPTYCKPMLHQASLLPRELNRLDFKSRAPLSELMQRNVMISLELAWPRLDALLVVDQVSEENCGVITALVRQQLAQLGEANPAKLILADSRERIGLFRSVWLKPNQSECERTVGERSEGGIIELARRAGRPVFCTRGDQGIFIADPRTTPAKTVGIPAYPVTGQIDIVGAGDSTSAGIACAIAAGSSLPAAAAFGNLVASITIQQLGTTGTASRQQVRQRWQQLR